MSLPGSYSLSLPLAAALQNATFLNLTSPAAGDWFLLAHLPEGTGKIEVKVRGAARGLGGREG